MSCTRSFLVRALSHSSRYARNLQSSFGEAMAPEDDMMELTSIKQGEDETLWEFIKRFHRAVLDLRAFNHPQALRGLKEEAKIGRLWYDLRSPIIQSYFAAYEQTLTWPNYPLRQHFFHQPFDLLFLKMGIPIRANIDWSRTRLKRNPMVLASRGR